MTVLYSRTFNAILRRQRIQRSFAVSLHSKMATSAKRVKTAEADTNVAVDELLNDTNGAVSTEVSYDFTTTSKQAEEHGSPPASTMTEFKKWFKFYKAKKPLLDLSNVLDVTLSGKTPDKIREVSLSPSSLSLSDGELSSLGLTLIANWKAYEVLDHPGLIIIPNVVSTAGQYRWAEKCLKAYPKAPHKTNIDKFIADKGPDYNIMDNSKSLHHLRWCTLGYHHNWETKVYTEDNRSFIPDEMFQLCRVAADAVGFRDFKAEAAIVHYYHHDSSLSGHVDRSERNMEPPLLSFSIGQSAIFLVGGHSLEDKCDALILRGGDLMIMTKESRKSYHAVPKILVERTFTEEDFVDLDKDSLDEMVIKCLNTNRFNINVRQVD